MIKNIIYLDETKMYSLSSQIFEGITEYILNENKTMVEKNEEQKGPIASGRILGDVLKTSGSSIEKKFLHDYSYTIFEKKLIEDDRVFEVSNLSVDIPEVSLGTKKYSFIKIKGKAIFSDVEKITGLLENFNPLGEALAHVISHDQIKELKETIEQKKMESHDRNEVAKLNTILKEKTNSKVLAKTQGLQQDPELMKNLSLLVKYGFSNDFQIQQVGENVIFTSHLKRECFREKEDLIVKKYSRKTEKEFVIFGIVSQAFESNKPNIDNSNNPPNLKAAIMNMIEHLTNVESSISGKQENEIIIDPIAVYTNL